MALEGSKGKKRPQAAAFLHLMIRGAAHLRSDPMNGAEHAGMSRYCNNLVEIVDKHLIVHQLIRGNSEQLKRDLVLV
jgi:hypothetical protein